MTLFKSGFISLSLVVALLTSSASGFANEIGRLPNLSEAAQRTIEDLQGHYPLSVLSRVVLFEDGRMVSQVLILVGSNSKSYSSDYLPTTRIDGKGSWMPIIAGSALSVGCAVFRGVYLDEQDRFGKALALGLIAMKPHVAAYAYSWLIRPYFELSSWYSFFLATPYGYLSNASQVESASKEILEHMSNNMETSEMVVVTRKNLFNRVESHLIENFNYVKSTLSTEIPR